MNHDEVSAAAAAVEAEEVAAAEVAAPVKGKKAKAAKEPKEPKEPKAAKEPKAEVVKDIRNGVTRPAAGSKTGFVWETADTISQREGRPAYRKEVLEITTEAGVNPATGQTQYAKWRAYHGLKGIIKAPADEPAAGATPVAEAQPALV